MCDMFSDTKCIKSFGKLGFPIFYCLKIQLQVYFLKIQLQVYTSMSNCISPFHMKINQKVFDIFMQK